MYIQACMQDKCACNGSEDSFCLCSTISEYSRQCSHAGGRPGEWRTHSFCRKQLYEFYKEIFHGYSTLAFTFKFILSLHKLSHILQMSCSSAINCILYSCSFLLLLPLLLRNHFQQVEILFPLKTCEV